MPMKRPLAYITAPWGDNEFENTETAARYCRAVYDAGFSPVCPLLFMPLFLNDKIPQEHKDGIDMARDFLRRSHVLVVCGNTVDENMKNDIAVAERLRITATMDEFHLLLKEEQTAAYSVEIWKRFRKWGGIPTGITQNVKDLLSSREVENIFENSDFVYMLNQAGGDRQILAKQLNISPHQLSYVTHSGEGEGLLFYGNVILPFIDRFPKDTELYAVMTTKPNEMKKEV